MSSCFPETFHIAIAEAPRPRVLVVDDEPLIRWSLAEALGERGYSVVEAGTGREAIDEVLASSEPFGVIVLDLRLPDSDNLSLLDAPSRVGAGGTDHHDDRRMEPETSRRKRRRAALTGS